ncbi:efflux RND transporter periplasmic adaptor subunit [Clostridium sp. DJ247]|nr:efflux RND transporter periplasmic adaptor subunit [Clostridium sp. DJ247]
MIIILTISLVGMIGTACGSEKKDATGSVKEVQIATIKKEKMVNLSEISGSLKAADEATISFEVNGVILSLNKKEGDTVKVGETLATLDKKEYMEKLNQADASVMQAQASLNQVRNGSRPQEIAQQKANVESLTAVYEKAAKDLQNAELLFKSGAISKNDYENAQNQAITSEKNLEYAKQGYAMMLDGSRQEVIDQAVAQYDAELSSKQQAALTLEKTELKAPINGIVIEKDQSQGQLVQAGTSIYKIGNLDMLKVTLPVPDRDISLWKLGDKVNLKLNDTSKQGIVTKIFPSTNESTGTIGVEVSVQNPNHDWVQGQVVNCLHEVEGEEGLFVPVESVINTGDGKCYVFLASGGKAVKTEVRVGTMFNNKFQITSGLKEGDTLVVKGADRLFNNDSIKAVGGDKND